MPPKPAPKRKSDAQDIDTAVGPSGSIAKKPRITHSDPAAASTAKLVDDILTNVAEWTLPKELQAKQIVVYLATYARLLELDLEIERAQKAQAGGASRLAEKDVKTKTREELESAAEKIRRSTASGICKQMTWKPTCATGRAKFSYDGVCVDPELFGVVMKLDGPPAWKMKKFTVEEMQSIFGTLEGKVRYAVLKLTKDLTVRYSDGEFKISGTYGKP